MNERDFDFLVLTEGFYFKGNFRPPIVKKFPYFFHSQNLFNFVVKLGAGRNRPDRDLKELVKKLFYKFK
jgi:hypothetical protein